MGKIKFGIKNAYYAPVTAVTASGYTYGTPVPLPGARSLSLEAQGDSTDEYFDDILWYHADSNSGYSGSLELAYVPDSFYEDVLKETKDSNDIHFEDANAQPVEFALLFQFNYAGAGSVNGSRICMYRCTASRPGMTHNTKQSSITADTSTINIVAMPRETDGLVRSRCESNQTPYETWFNSVYEKATTGE